ncbi:MAG: hypothetical protein K2M84_04085 [Anaeroplasmataceae bacterium]|nr:hypothetical protein [Anaeroplasmataceae bacterium]
MKKILIKGIMLGLFVASYLFIQPVQKFLNKEINTVAITNFLAENLYKDEENVASVPMVVRDYIVEGNKLYVFPLSQEVSLPIDVMIVSVEEGAVEVVNLDTRFRISHISKRTGNLYQYVHSLNSFGLTEDFFVVEGEDLTTISGRLSIYYEKV